MRAITTKRKRSRPGNLRSRLPLACMLAVTSVGLAAPPLVPLPPPDYSFDLASCTVDGGAVGAGDVLFFGSPDPNTLVPGEAIGLLEPEDDLDALSAANASITVDDTFVLLFSVSAGTVGAVPPDAELIGLNVPYNVLDQAARTQAPGDQFMSTRLFRLTGIVAGSTSNNNLLDRNNYDEGGTDFVAQPPTAAHEFAGDDPLDVVDATAWLDRAEGEVDNLYFSATSESPSLPTLPYWGEPSGADVFFNNNPPTYVPTTLYAAHEQLQLDPNDNIDAVIVFDTNNTGEFDGTDQVLFSLAPGSPSLGTIPGTAADVFTVTYGEGPVLFAAAGALGLGHPDDDINALDFLLCADPIACAALHGIRGMPGDLDGDCDVDTSDLGKLLAAYGACEGAPEFDPVADIDGDGCVRLADLGVLLAAYGKTCD